MKTCSKQSSTCVLTTDSLLSINIVWSIDFCQSQQIPCKCYIQLLMQTGCLSLLSKMPHTAVTKWIHISVFWPVTSIHSLLLFYFWVFYSMPFSVILILFNCHVLICFILIFPCKAPCNFVLSLNIIIFIVGDWIGIAVYGVQHIPPQQVSFQRNQKRS